MRKLYALSLLFSSLLAAQTTAVNMRDEPHHTLEFQNDYVRVYRITVPAGDSLPTIAHAHDYLTIRLPRPPESPSDEQSTVASISSTFMALTESHPPMRYGQAKTTTPAYLNTAESETVTLVIELLQEKSGGPSSIAPDAWDTGHGVRGTYWYRSRTGKIRGWDTYVKPDATYRPSRHCSPRQMLLIADTPVAVQVLAPGEVSISLGSTQQLWIGRTQSFEINNGGTQPLHFFVLRFSDRPC